MPPHTRARSRRNATKRTILGSVDENEASVETSFTKIAQPIISSMHEDGRKFKVAGDFDGTSSGSMAILLQDLENDVKNCQENLSIKANIAMEDQQQLYFLESMKLPRSVKNMTIQEFNEKYFVEGDDIVQQLENIANYSGGRNKRGRTANQDIVSDTTVMKLETPARLAGMELRTPATLTRTVKRGEFLYSVNGSPVEQAEKGDLVATVSKKRRGNDTAIFDINVGEGCYINLSDPCSLNQLDDEMKTTAKTQLKVLQDQMARLMASLGNES